MKIPKIETTQNGQYYCRLRIGGQSVAVYGASERECREQAQFVKAKHKVGLLEEKKAELTLSEAIDIYIENRKLSPTTVKGYRACQKFHFQSIMRKKLSNDINWQKIVNGEASRYSPKTVANNWKFIKSVLEYSGFNAPKVSLPQLVNNSRPWLDHDEILVFLKAINGRTFELEALLALHSLRLSEIYGLDWENVDLVKKTITVKGALVRGESGQLIKKRENKNISSERTLPIMIPRLYELLLARQAASGQVAAGYPDSLRRAVNRVAADAGLPQIGAHGLRRSFASLAHFLGVPERDCMYLGGWSNPATMHSIYVKISEKGLARQANKMTEFFENAK